MWMSPLKRKRASPFSIARYSSHCLKVPHATGSSMTMENVEMSSPWRRP
jgi:hypothetical protein